MAPAAARTANMLKNATSLTEIYAEHFNLINELESTKADMRHAEKTIIQLREILVEHEPIIRERQEHYDQAIREVEILREQLDRHRRDRDELITTRNAYSHELHFTKESLEKYQRECQTLSKQVRSKLSV
jgi:chromosome segregation ATPase